VEEKHGVKVHKVMPSLDRDVYFKGPDYGGGPVRVAAMVRYHSPRRGPERTMRVLRRLSEEFGDSVEIHIFGTSPEELKEAWKGGAFSFKNHGYLVREGVAEVLRNADVFMDLSDYQAFGRTGLEAMACGCSVVLPAEGGVGEYARDGVNALVVDTKSEDACYEAARRLVLDSRLRFKLREGAVNTATQYSVDKAALSVLIYLKSAWLSAPQKPSVQPGQVASSIPSAAASQEGCERAETYLRS